MDTVIPTVQPNTHVVIEYTLKDDDGEVLDTSTGDDGEPIAYVHGYGMLVPGLEAALGGLMVGEEKDIVVPAAEGYGERDEELVMEVERAEFPEPEKLTAGDEFVAESADGEEVVMRVLELKDDAVVVDANHPLAGMTLHYAVKVTSVRPATEEEITTAATEFDDDDHVHGPGCSHDHEPDLISLGKKKTPNLPN